MRYFLSFLQKTTPLEIAWILLWLGTISFAQRSAADSLSGDLDATHLQRFAFDAVALVLMSLYLHRIPKPKMDPIAIYLLFGILAVASTLWSVSPVATMGKAGEVFIGATIVWITMGRPNSLLRLRRLIDWVLIFIGSMLVYSLAGYILNPDEFSWLSNGLIERQIWSNIVSSNNISDYGAFLALTCYARFLISKSKLTNLIYIFLFLFFSIFPILAQGRAGIAVYVVGFALLAFRKKPILAIATAPVLFIAASSQVIDTASAFFMRGQHLDLFLTLSGRTKLWERGWNAFLENPFVGVGFGVGGRSVFLTNVEGFNTTISSLHNGFLETLVGVGLVGLMLWMIPFLWGCSMAAVDYVRGRHIDIVIGFTFVLATTMMTSGAGGWMSPILGFFLAATAYLATCRRQERAVHKNRRQQKINYQHLNGPSEQTYSTAFEQGPITLLDAHANTPRT